jgi:hypothetical protein
VPQQLNKPSLFLLTVTVLVFGSLISGSAPTSYAQASDDDVHVVPRIGVGVIASTDENVISPSASKSIRVSADLVLIPGDGHGSNESTCARTRPARLRSL